MSRIGSMPVLLPSSVKVELAGSVLSFAGPMGKRVFECDTKVKASIDGNKLSFSVASSVDRAIWGTVRSIVNSIVEGLVKPFEVRLNLVGVGYNAACDGKVLTLKLGYSHPVLFPVPEDVEIICEKPTSILLKSIDKQRLGQVKSQIIAKRPPEPYKGKGVVEEGSFVYRKERKKK